MRTHDGPGRGRIVGIELKMERLVGVIRVTGVITFLDDLDLRSMRIEHLTKTEGYGGHDGSVGAVSTNQRNARPQILRTDEVPESRIAVIRIPIRFAVGTDRHFDGVPLQLAESLIVDGVVKRGLSVAWRLVGIVHGASVGRAVAFCGRHVWVRRYSLERRSPNGSAAKSLS